MNSKSIAKILRMPLGDALQLPPSASMQQREVALQASPEERYNYVQRIVVPIPQYRQAFDILQSLYDATGKLDDSGGARIYGNSGVGKSVICRNFFQQHPPEETVNGVMLPVLLLEMEQKITARSFLAGLLKSLGYPFTSGKNAFQLADILAEGLRHRGVKLVLVDEAQEAGEGQGIERPKEIANVIKRIKDKSGVAFAFVGTERGLRRFFTLGDQLATRITTEHTLLPLQFDKQFIAVLSSFDRALPTASLSGLDEQAIAQAIHAASQGNFRCLRKLLAYAVQVSAQQGAQSISRKHLCEAYCRAFGTGPNPFGS